MWQSIYHAQVRHSYTPYGLTRHLVIHRLDDKPVRAGWNVLQKIKNDMLGEDAVAIEVFPPQDELIDEANWRHFWEAPPKQIPSLVED